MPKKQRKQADEYSDAVAEQRANDALRRALTTPYKTHREMVGKSNRTSSPHKSKTTPPKTA